MIITNGSSLSYCSTLISVELCGALILYPCLCLYCVTAKLRLFKRNFYVLSGVIVSIRPYIRTSLSLSIYPLISVNLLAAIHHANSQF